MKTIMNSAARTSGYAYRALTTDIPGMPRIAFAPEDGVGNGAPDDTAKAEAAKAAAKELADAEAAAAKELADAEAAAAAAADDTKDAAALKAEKAKLLAEVMDKKGKLKDAEKKAADAAAALAAYDGIDPAKVRELLKREADAEKASAEAKGDFDRVKAMMAEEHQKETKALNDKIAELQGQISANADMINNLTVGNDFGASVFVRDSLTLTPSKARALYGAHFESVDGQTVAYDKPAGKANRTMLVGANGDPLPFDEAFKRIIDADPDKEMLLKAKTNAGSSSSSTPTKVVEKAKETGLYGTSRIAAGLKDFV